MSNENSSLLTPSILKTIEAAQRRDLLPPLLLFLAGHKPLAFVTGQLLHFGLPLSAIVGYTAVQDWAELLSHPEGPSMLERLLHAPTDPGV